jgi:hypothetical protein
VLSKNRARKSHGKGVGNHEVGPKGNEAHNISSIKLAAKMDADVTVARRFLANRIGRHDNARQVVLIDISRRSLCVTHIAKNSAKVENFLANLARCNVFSLRRRESDRILAM